MKLTHLYPSVKRSKGEVDCTHCDRSGEGESRLLLMSLVILVGRGEFRCGRI